MPRLRKPIEVLVATREGLGPWRPVRAHVRVRIGAQWRPLDFDGRLHTADRPLPIEEVSVERAGYHPEVRRVVVQHPPIRETFFLARVDGTVNRLMRRDGHEPFVRNVPWVGVLPASKLRPLEAWALMRDVGGLFGPVVQVTGEPWPDQPPPDFQPQPFLIGRPPEALDLAALRALPVAAGPVIGRSPRGFTIMKHHIVGHFQPLSPHEIGKRLDRIALQFQDLVSVEPIPGPRPLVRWMAHPRLGIEVADLAQALVDFDPLLRSAEVEVDGTVVSDAPSDPAWSWQRSLPSMGFPEVWGQGRFGAGRTLAVLDRPADFRGLHAVHPELSPRLTNGFWDPDDVGTADWSLTSGTHGTLCLGVVLAAHSTEGVAGAAPGATGFAGGIDRNERNKSLLRAAGLGSAASPPAEIISSSLGFDENLLTLTTEDQQTLEQVVLAGRGGRGCPIFLSAGNNGGRSISLNRAFRASPLTLTCGATALLDQEETWAMYTDCGPVDFCALAFDPPGMVPSTGSRETDPVWTLGPSSSTTHLSWTGGVVPGKGALLILRRGTGAAAEHTIVRVATAETDPQGVVQVGLEDALPWTDFQPVDVRCELMPWVEGFGQTSAATPLCTAAGLLVLEADPLLSWVELRAVLRETAVRESLRIRGAPGTPVWPPGTEDAPHNHLGFGRLNVAKAVEAALTRRGSADTTRAWPMLQIADVRVTLPNQTDPAEVRRGRTHSIRVEVKNQGARPGLEAWLRVTLLASSDALVDWTANAKVLEMKTFSGTVRQKTVRFRLVSDLLVGWDAFFIRVDLLPHHGPIEDPVEAKTRSISERIEILPAYDAPA